MADEVAVPNFLDEGEQQEREFIALLLRSLRGRVHPQTFQTLLQDAPVALPLFKLQKLVCKTFNFRNTVDSETLRVILEYEPDIARTTFASNGHQTTLLHQACLGKTVSLDTVQLVYECHPDAIRMADSVGGLPLHRAFTRSRTRPSLDIIRFLLSHHPDSIRVAETELGMLPLHEAFFAKAPDDVISALLDIYPEAIKVPMKSGTLALHMALEYMEDLPLKLLHYLVEYYPEAVRLHDSRGVLPVHQTSYVGHGTLAVLKYLVGEYPDSVRAKGLYQQYPLHFAAWRGASLDIIQFLVDSFPDAVNATNHTGSLPLHLACRSEKTSPEVFKLLIDRYQGPHHFGLSVVNDRGRIPLHNYASGPNHDPASLELLLVLYPEGVRVADRNGRLPLHQACNRAHPVLDTICQLVETDKFTVVQKTSDGRTPYQLAWRLQRRHPDVETYLVEKQNEVVNAMKEAFEEVADTQLGLPDLVVARVWSFAKPDLWQPPEEERELAMDLDEDDLLDDLL